MIDFRYHVVSIVAVFLALALGLFLGSTTLQGTVANSLTHQAAKVRGENRSLEQQLSLSQQQLGQQQTFAGELQPLAVRGRLTGATVALVSAPGVADSDRTNLATALAQAGATVVSDVRLASSYLDQTQSAELGQLATELEPTGFHPPAGSGVVQADALLADLLVQRSPRPSTQQRLETALTAFADGKLLTLGSGMTPRPASLAVLEVPAPSASTSASDAQATSTALLTFARDLAADGVAAALAGPSPTVVPGGVLGAATSGDGAVLTSHVSTVDSTDQAAGRIALVLALDRARNGVVGRYGPAQHTPLPSTSAGP